MRKIIYILSIVLAAVSCADIRHVNPYEEGMHVLTVAPQWPKPESSKNFWLAPSRGQNIISAEVRVEDMNTGSRYVSQTGADGTATFTLPNGLYRVTLSGRDGSDVFNASADKVVISGSDHTLALTLSISKAGSIVIKELYCGGCKKLPQEGDYQADQYIILHNNDYQVQYLDRICFGTLSPYNSELV